MPQLGWGSEYEDTFHAAKEIVVRCDCLTTINHQDMGDNKIFVTANASDRRSGAVISYSPTWETACPVAFDSMTFKGVELNYLVHKKELLAIIHSLQHWCSDLIGSPVYIYTDHRTLENFSTQQDLFRCQAHWMEFLAQFNCCIVYVKGQDNTAADALSRTKFLETPDPESIALAPFNEDSESMAVASGLLCGCLTFLCCTLPHPHTVRSLGGHGPC
jgi:hypothetical protein